MLFYIDYLDHVTSGSKSSASLALRLRFDLLVFGKDTLCMSVPACIKLRDTTRLLIQLDDFWKNGKIQLQLDAKHKGNPKNYFNNRKRVLERNIQEQKLSTHFEYVAYRDERTTRFFGTYLPQMLSVPSTKIYIGKTNDTDYLFRKDSIELFEKHYDPVCKTLDANRTIVFTGIVNRIQGIAYDRANLFQRALIEDLIIDEFNPKENERLVVATLLDRAFLKAAFITECISVSMQRRSTKRLLSLSMNPSSKENAYDQCISFTVDCAACGYIGLYDLCNYERGKRLNKNPALRGGASPKKEEPIWQ